MNVPAEALTFVGAELAFLMVRSRDLKILVKGQHERTPHEQRRVARGLRRATVIDALLFVPASASLLVLLAPLILPEVPPQKVYAAHTLLGVTSYGFPFSAVRGFIRRVALNSLREFAQISIPPPAAEDDV